MSVAAPVVSGVLETCLYVIDVPRARAFYERVFGFHAMIADERLCADFDGGKHAAGRLAVMPDLAAVAVAHAPFGVGHSNGEAALHRARR